MATKSKTPQFNSRQAKDKWANLENQAGHSLDKIVQGQASSGDIQRVSRTLAQLSDVARTVFDEAVDVAAKTAKQLQVASNIEIKSELSEFEIALNKSLQPSFQEVIKQIQDIFELDLLEQTEELTKTMGSSFTDLLERLPPKDLPTVNDLLANNELIADEVEKKALKSSGGTGTSLTEVSDDIWQVREDNLLDRVYAMFTDVLKNIKIKVTVGAPRQPANIAEQAQDFVGPPKPAHLINSSANGDSTTPVSTAALSATDATVSTVEEGKTREQSLFDRLEQFLDNQEGGGGGAGSEEDTKEKKKADTWWRSFKDWFGGGVKKAKSSSGNFLKDLMKDLTGVGLLSLIFNPQLWKTLADNIEKYVTWDNIKAAALTSWDWLSKQAHSVVDWVMEKLGLNKPDKAKVSKEEQARFVNSVPTKDKFSGMGPDTKGAILDNMTPAQREAEFKNDPKLREDYKAWTQKRDQGSKYQTAIGKWWGGVTDSVTNIFSPSVKGGQRSTVNNVTGGSSSSSANTVAKGPSISITPGVTSSSANPTLTEGQSRSPTQATGSPQLGMDSFGFQSGVDDSLLLMNSSFLGH